MRVLPPHHRFQSSPQRHHHCSGRRCKLNRAHPQRETCLRKHRFSPLYRPRRLNPRQYQSQYRDLTRRYSRRRSAPCRPGLPSPQRRHHHRGCHRYKLNRAHPQPETWLRKKRSHPPHRPRRLNPLQCHIHNRNCSRRCSRRRSAPCHRAPPSPQRHQ